ncbi:MAG: DcaP family trimeric outer membrane transporter [Pseudomonadota bacterium]
MNTSKSMTRIASTTARTSIRAAVAIALATSSCSAAAATNEELEARIAQLEAVIAELVAGEKEQESEPQLVQLERPETKWPTLSDDDGSSTRYSFGGYIKVDAMFSDLSAGDLAPSSAGTQFYIPGTIPVGDAEGEGPDAAVQARETRLSFKSEHTLASGKQASTYIELDFFLSGFGNERVSNSYAPRMRHAYLTYDKWLIGQTWTTFQDVGALPENLDFVGPAESTVFNRQGMIRYTHGALELAIENPETTLTPNGGGARIVSDDGPLPDFAARYTFKLANGYIKAAGLLRSLDYDIGGQDDSTVGYGLSVSGKHNFGRDDFRWMATTGSGMGRYIGLNTSNGGVLDSAGNIEAIDQFGIFGSYRHFWNDNWRSNLTLSYLSNDNPVDLTGDGVTKEAYSVHLNLLYSPYPRMTVGGELIYAQRETESGADGDLTRLLVSAKYAF